jgi:hypothetical protein
MSFSPVIPFGGYAGWSFLQRTQTAQRTAFETDPAARRDEAYFREKIGDIKTAEALVSDRRLLRVALGAYGLDGDIGNKAFIRKILAEGTLKVDSLANKLANKQYQALSAAFGFDLSVPRTQVSTFADKIVSAFKTRQFETAVGNQSNDMRLAMNARRELETLADRPISEKTKWLTVLGNPPLRQVLERAFSLPASFGSVDLDRQVEVMRTRSEKSFGASEITQFNDPKQVEKLLRRFLTQSDLIANGAGTGTSAALQLLQSGSFGRLSQRI